jgi:hypothetical protein
MANAPDVPTSQPEPQVVLESRCLKNIIDYLELNIGELFSVDDLTAMHAVKRRTIHEFLAVCSAFGMCIKFVNGSLRWLGRQQVEVSIHEMRAAIPGESRGKTLPQIFDCSADSSLSHIATSLVKLHCVLGTKFLDLRKVGRLLSQRGVKYKTVLRKLYTVASILTLVSVLRRTASSSEVQFVYPLKPPGATQFGVSVMLNTQTELEEEQSFERRRREFEQICLAKGSSRGT